MATRLHVNVDHFATIRQQRHTSYPDPVAAAALAELAGAQGITVHLREDRRHIQDRDVRLLRQTVQTRLNLEMAMTDEMQQIALEVLPDIVTLVPERREELTTEGGLDVVGLQESLQSFLAPLSSAGMECALFIDPNPAQIKAARELNVPLVELSTASYCEAPFGKERQRELQRLREMAALAHSLGLEVAAGHGLDYTQVAEVAEIPEIVELNIGHSMVARASLVGLERAVKEMLVLLGQTTA